MDKYKGTARIVGALFLIAMVSYLLGASIIDSVINAPDYLTTVSDNEPLVIIGVLLEIINIVAVLGIAVMVFPVLGMFSENIARGYFSFRLLEAAVLVVAVISPLLLITLSQEYLTAAAAETSHFHILGRLVIETRAQLAGLLLAVFFSLGALLFYYQLYQAKLVPRFISVWGLIAVVLVLTWNLLEAFGISINAGIVFGLPIILNEIFLGIWLIVKGFNTSIIPFEIA